MSPWETVCHMGRKSMKEKPMQKSVRMRRRMRKHVWIHRSKWTQKSVRMRRTGGKRVWLHRVLWMWTWSRRSLGFACFEPRHLLLMIGCIEVFSCRTWISIHLLRTSKSHHVPEEAWVSATFLMLITSKQKPIGSGWRIAWRCHVWLARLVPAWMLAMERRTPATSWLFLVWCGVPELVHVPILWAYRLPTWAGRLRLRGRTVQVFDSVRLGRCDGLKWKFWPMQPNARSKSTRNYQRWRIALLFDAWKVQSLACVKCLSDKSSTMGIISKCLLVRRTSASSSLVCVPF